MQSRSPGPAHSHRRRRVRACGASPWPSPPAWPTASPPASTRATRPPRQPSLRARCEAVLSSAAGNQHSCRNGTLQVLLTHKHTKGTRSQLQSPSEHLAPCRLCGTPNAVSSPVHATSPCTINATPLTPPNHQPTKRNDDRIPSEHCLSLLMRTVRACVQIAAFAVSPCFAMFLFCE